MDAGQNQDDANLGPEARAEIARQRRRKLAIGVISAFLAAILMVVVLNLVTRNTNLRYMSLSVAELQERTGEQYEAIGGMLEISDVTYRDSAGHVFDEEPREALVVQQQSARAFLDERTTAGTASSTPTKEEAREELKAAEEELKNLFQAIRDVQAAMDDWDDMH